MQVFVELGGNTMLDGTAYGVGREAGTHAFAEAGDTAAVFSGTVPDGTERRTRADAAEGSFAYGGFFPVPAVGMVLAASGRRCRAEKPRQEDRNQENATDPHTKYCARDVPCRVDNEREFRQVGSVLVVLTWRRQHEWKIILFSNY